MVSISLGTYVFGVHIIIHTDVDCGSLTVTDYRCLENTYKCIK